MYNNLEFLKETIFIQVNQVFDIFIHHFGEQHVDLIIPDDTYLINQLLGITQREINNLFPVTEDEMEFLKCSLSQEYLTIKVWWPEVIVTNEYNNSIKIDDLYAKIKITYNGTMPLECKGFYLKRATFTTAQWITRYQHSHVPKRRSNTIEWEIPCLGRGPIKNTILELINTNEDAVWMLFCDELDKYVKVESLSGGPYMRMTNVKISTTTEKNNFSDPGTCFYRNMIERDKHKLQELLEQFTHWYLKHCNISFDFIFSTYQIGTSYYSYIIDVSNAFIKYFNLFGNEEDVEWLFTHKILKEVLCRDYIFYKYDINLDTVEVNNQVVLNFKGQNIPLRIYNDEENDLKSILILDHYIAMYILSKILILINYYYNGNNTNTSEASVTTNKEVCFL